MDTEEYAIIINDLTKIYPLYDRPVSRMKEALHPFRKRYHSDFYALKNITLAIGKGTTLGVIGKNGSGKSTLLKIISGILTPSAGSVQAGGKITSLLELGAGFNPELTGIENIYLNGSFMGLHRTDVDRKLDEILAFADIGAFVYQPVKFYSSGMFVRLAFALAINVEPLILVIDEVFSVGDIRFQQKCFRKIEELRSRQVTILLASHDMGSIMNYCDRAIWLMDGQIARHGDPRDVCKNFAAYMYYDASPTMAAADSPDTPGVIYQIPGQAAEWEDINSHDSFGAGGAVIEKITLCSTAGHGKIKILRGHERVSLMLQARVHQNIDTTLVGFLLRDEYGNNIAGMNNSLYRITLPPLKQGNRILIEFEFDFPRIKNGIYTFSVAIADGTHDNHIQHHWVHDAFIVQVYDPSVLGNCGHYIILENPTVTIVGREE